MATPKASPVKKTERKKPVRKSPALKDFPTKLDWLRAMTEYEESQAATTATAKVARFDKRIAAKKKAIAKLETEISVLEADRSMLVPVDPEDEATDPVTDEVEQPQG